VIVVDTTILISAVGGEHELREPSGALLAAAREGRIAVTTTPEVIQEFVHARARRRGRADAASLGRDLATGLAPLVVVDEEDLAIGLALFERTQLGSFDSVLAALALRRGCTLVSADRAFGEVPGLVHVAPGTPAFAELLAG
jgi:hypothetical protein